MEVYRVKTGSILPLGKQGENLAKQIQFDISRWISNFGPGTVQLLHKRSGDETPYPVAVEQEGDRAVWTVTSADTAAAGTGRAELQYYVGDALAKSETWMTKVLPALGDASEMPPEAQQSWVDQVLQAGTVATEAAEKAANAAVRQPIVGGNGNWWTWDLEAGAYVDTGIYSGGDAPYIGDNGNWYVGQTDTGVPATGQDGKTAYQYAVEGGYTGTEEAFAAKLAGNGLTAAQIDLLEDAFEHIQWADDAGPQYAAQLITSLRGGEQPEQPDTPKTLTSISAEYSGGNVAVGTELSSLSGITVTAHYSDGTTATVTSYTLSGTIAEGDNTITVTYMGKTATIIVTGEAQSADDRTLLHNWILNDQNDSNIDTVSGATIGSVGITKSSDGWEVTNVYNYIYAENVNGYNRSIECDIAISTVAEDLGVGIFIGFGTVKKNPTHYISYRNKTWGWESTDTYKTEKVITDLVGANPFSSKTLVLCVNAEGYIDLYLDGAYLSTSPWAVTAPNLVLGCISKGYAPFTVSGIRIYEGVL